MDTVELKKQMNNILKKAHDDSKLEYCLCCKKNVTSFCNSHSLPRFILKNISNDGYVLTSNNYFKMPLFDNSKGLNNSGIFKRICRECDKKLFKNYESTEQLLSRPMKKIMTQIDLKNCLRMYDKRLNEIALYDILLNKNPNNFMLRNFIETQRVNYLDLNEIKNELERDLQILSKSSSSSFELIFWEKLDYVTPIAYQGHIALVGDLKGNTINDIYNKNEQYVIENINICVFPLPNQTIVMVFINKDNKKYKEFIRQFKLLTKDQKLQLISYIIFNYSEDFFVSREAKEEILESKVLDMTAQNITNIYALDKEMANQFKHYKNYELLNYIKFPNLLSDKYSISKLQNNNYEI